MLGRITHFCKTPKIDAYVRWRSNYSFFMTGWENGKEPDHCIILAQSTGNWCVCVQNSPIENIPIQNNPEKYENKQKQDCSYQGETLNVPTAF